MLTRTLSSGPGLFAQPQTYMMLNSRIHKQSNLYTNSFLGDTDYILKNPS